jgi:hypothetical protein
VRECTAVREIHEDSFDAVSFLFSIVRHLLQVGPQNLRHACSQGEYKIVLKQSTHPEELLNVNARHQSAKHRWSVVKLHCL